MLEKLERLLERFSFGALETVLERHALLASERVATGAARPRPAAEGAAGGGAA
jgi:hypothetical protein